MIIKNGLVFCDDFTFRKKDITVINDIITNISDSSDQKDNAIIDATNLYVIPGLVDIHSHGAVGYDCSDANVSGLLNILEYEKSKGITSYCPTTMTLPKEQILDALKAIKNANSKREKKHARIAGVHLEGPFIDEAKKGAQDSKNILPPDKSFFLECNEACGNLIKMITIAPNLPESITFINDIKELTTISLGHTSTDYKTAKKAFEAGAKHVTHLYNGMTAFSHRDPALIGAAFDSKDTVVELICDKIHIDDSVIRMTFQLFENRVSLISDSMRATGLSDGRYDLGGQGVNVNGKLATLDDGTIAGSVTCLFDCMKNIISMGIPLESAIASATAIPARSIGLTDIGTISVGAYADILLLDKDLNIIKII